MRFLLPLALCAALWGSAQATSVKRVELGTLTEISEVVFLGHVVDQSVKAENGQVWTELTFDIDEIWKGKAQSSRIKIRQLGGFTEELQQIIVGYPQFELGERVVLFLERTSTQRLVVAGLSMGKYHVESDRYGNEIASRDTHDLSFYKKDHHPVVYLKNAPQNIERLPLEQLKALVQNQMPPVPLQKAEPQLLRLPAFHPEEDAK